MLTVYMKSSLSNVKVPIYVSYSYVTVPTHINIHFDEAENHLYTDTSLDFPISFAFFFFKITLHGILKTGAILL